MFKFYVIRGSNLPPADPNGKSDPYCVLTAYAADGPYKLGKTKIKKKTLNPVWDEKREKPFYLYTPLIKKLEILVYDHDLIGKDDYLGKVEIDFFKQIPTFDQIIKIPLVTDLKTKGNPSIEIVISREFKFESEDNCDPILYHRSAIYLEYDPPIPKQQQDVSSLGAAVFDMFDGGCCRLLPKIENGDDRGCKVYIYPWALTDSGCTQILTLNPFELERHYPTSEHLFYVPLILMNLNYTGKVKLTCIGLNKENKKPPILHFQQLFEFKGSDLINCPRVIRYSDNKDYVKINIKPNNCLNHFSLDRCISLTSVPNKNMHNYLLSVKSLVVNENVTDEKIFHRINLNVDDPFPIQVALKYFQRPLPDTIHIFAEHQLLTTAGFQFDIGFIAYDINFNHIDFIYPQKPSMFNDAVKLAIDENGRYNEFGREIYSIIKLNQLPPEVFCLSFGVSENTNKKFNTKLGAFFRVYDAKDDLELMGFTGRKKGFHSCVWIFSIFRCNGDWAIVPTMRTYSGKGLVGGIIALNQSIKEDMKKERYFDRILKQ
ncbi:Fer-1-like 4 [Histomonas meleagridis]|uniref:Fer-1-like 4 n=1 Tax=Histomonas meleagridis TaxID=135588 RepID=UPI0035596DE9|nr:Fer-1-like 4 [Histomonas meleagridis]KAH0803775.1 Fer-1-like 4 [Histomonas meleagridis]